MTLYAAEYKRAHETVSEKEAAVARNLISLHGKLTNMTLALSTTVSKTMVLVLLILGLLS
jgi:hypothetical protein